MTDNDKKCLEFAFILASYGEDSDQAMAFQEQNADSQELFPLLVETVTLYRAWKEQQQP